MKSQEYLNEIRKSQGLTRAVLRGITVENGEAIFSLVTDTNYTSDDVAYASRVSAKYAEGLRAQATVLKSIPDGESVRRSVAKIIRSDFPAFAAFVSYEDIEVVIDKNGGRFYIGVGEVERDMGNRDGVIDRVSVRLARYYCGNWVGEFKFCEKAKAEIEHEVHETESVLAPRFFEICEFSPIDGADPKPQHAIYIADLNKEMQGVTICGKITFIEERVTKAGKPYFSITVSDGSGSMRVVYFSKKATVEKVRDLRQGISVCLSGDNEIFNDNLSLRVKSVDFGSAPQGFVPEQRPSKPVPVQYKAVFPVAEEDLVQSDLFGVKKLPDDFAKENYVVFDLETTGLGLNAGAMDKIIEVGAVKITNGKISERFATFVACPVQLSREIIELTGITDDMLVGAPDIKDVIADFYKFSAGCKLVGQNVQFDSKFIRYYGEQEGYLFENKQYDTLTLAQELLRLKNYKLNTIAEHFGFTFRHHRAYEDAFVTAKIFIELIRIKGSLPQ